MMPEWKAKVQTKGKTRSNTHTHAQEELCGVREPTGDGMLYTHTERKHWEHGTQRRL